MSEQPVLDAALHDLCDVWCCVANALANLTDATSVTSPVLIFAFTGAPGETMPFRSFVPVDRLAEANEEFVSAIRLMLLDPDLDGRSPIPDALGAVFPATTEEEGELLLQGFVSTRYSDTLVGFTHALGEGPSVQGIAGPQLCVVQDWQLPEFATLIESWRQIVVDATEGAA